MGSDRTTTPSYRFGPFRIDPIERRLWRDDVPVALTPKAFDLLLALVENPGHLLEKDALMKRVWADAFVEEANLANNISLLRKTLGEGNSGVEYIETIPRRGYRFLADVTTLMMPSGNQTGPDASIPAEPARSPMASNAPVSAAAMPKRMRQLGLLGAVLLVIVAVAFTIRRTDEGGSDGHLVRFTVLPPPGTSLPPPFEPLSPELSPDGTRVAFRVMRAGQPALAIRAIDAIDAQIVANTAGARFPFWSPDSRTIGFFADGKLKRTNASGGPVQTICDAPDGYGGTWSNNNIILFAPRARDGLFTVPAAGGRPTQVTWLQKNEAFHQHPQFLPDGRRFIYFAAPDGIYLGSLEGGPSVRILTTRSQARYSPPGYLLFVQDRTLLVQRFDIERVRLVGDPLPIADDVPVGGLNVEGRPAGGGTIAVSQNGVLAYRIVPPIHVKLAWFDRRGELVARIGVLPFDRFSDPQLSPDAKQVALAHGAQPFADDIWVVDLATGRSTQITFHPAQDRRPVWSYDGRSLAFASMRPHGAGIYQKTLSSDSAEELLVPFPVSAPVWPSNWGASGMIYSTLNGEISMLPAATDRKPRSLVHASGLDAKLSSDGKWLAYTSNEFAESERPEVYVQSMSTPAAKWRISTDSGSFPQWRADGKELFYLAGDGTVMAVRIDAEASSLRPGVPEPLFETRLGTMPEGLRAFGVTRDGQRFLISVSEDSTATQSLIVVSNWQAALKP